MSGEWKIIEERIDLDEHCLFDLNVNGINPENEAKIRKNVDKIMFYAKAGDKIPSYCRLLTIDCNGEFSLDSVPDDVCELELRGYVPDVVGDGHRFKNLTSLSIASCSLEVFNQGDWTDSITHLNLNDNKGLYLNGNGELKNLIDLQIRGCDIIMFNSKFWSETIMYFDLSENFNLKRFDVSRFKNLDMLFLSSCNITDFYLDKLPNTITRLDLWNNEYINLIGDANRFKVLKYLDLSHSDLVEDESRRAVEPFSIFADMGIVVAK